MTTLRVDKLEGLRQQDREETARVHDHGIRQVRLGCQSGLIIFWPNFGYSLANSCQILRNSKAKLLHNESAEALASLGELQGTYVFGRLR